MSIYLRTVLELLLVVVDLVLLFVTGLTPQPHASISAQSPRHTRAIKNSLFIENPFLVKGLN